MIAFADETGSNMLPAGIFVSVAPAAGAALGTSWTQSGGLVNLSPVAGTAYVATFTGTQGPSTTQAFTGAASGTTNVTVTGYRSPSLSSTGYAVAQAALWPKGWFTPAARAPGGNAYPLAAAAGAVLALLDARVQSVLQAIRIQSSLSPECDTWATDMLGSSVMQYAGETDPAYVARVMATLSRGPVTRATMQAVVNEYFAYFSDGAVTHVVLDTMSDYVGSMFFGITYGQVAIVSFYSPATVPKAWFAGQDYVGQTTFVSNPYTFSKSGAHSSAVLTAMLNAIKAEGIELVFVTSYQAEPGTTVYDSAIADSGAVFS